MDEVCFGSRKSGGSGPKQLHTGRRRKPTTNLKEEEKMAAIHFHRYTPIELEEWASTKSLDNRPFWNTIRFACNREVWPFDHREGKYHITNIHDNVTCKACLKTIHRQINEKEFVSQLRVSLRKVLADQGEDLYDILP